MQRDKAYFFDIADSARLAVEYIAGISYEEFLNNKAIQDAVIRRIEIIGEAVNRISKESKIKYSYLPWNEMKGMRNLLIHEYDEIDLKNVWDTVKNDLPELILEIDKILQE
jgi:uncharacterized protein with HEPN domain